MLRLLVVVLLIVLVWLVLSALLERLRAPDGGRGGNRRRGAGGPAEPLLRCERCGVRVPRSRSLPAPGGGVFCSPACRQAARGPG
jgi:uncharacterized protein